MNSLSPTIFPDNTEVNGKMKMKSLNVNGDNITEIITGPKIIYRNGERSFLKSISIDGYRVTISYIDELFQGSVVEAVFGRREQSSCYLRRNGLDVIHVKLYPNGNTDISGALYDAVRKSWKTISFDIAPDIQDGYMRLQRNPSGYPEAQSAENADNMSTWLLTFDFVLPLPSKHALYSAFISDMKYMSKNTEEVKPIEAVKARDQMPQALSAIRAEIQRLNYRLDEIENKLRKFGIE